MSIRTARIEIETEQSAAVFVDGHPTSRTLEAYCAGTLLTKAEEAKVLRHLDFCQDCVPLLEGEEIFDQDFAGSKLREDLAALGERVVGEAARVLTFPGASDPPVDEPEDVHAPKIERVIAEVVTQLTPILRSRMAALEASGRDPEALHSADELVSKMLSAVPEPSAWNEMLGPFYRTRQMAAVLGLATSTVTRRRQRRSLLGLKTADDVLVYPAFQLDANNRLLAGLPETLGCFRDLSVDDWTLAGWFVTPHQALEGYSVVDALRSDGASERLLAFARDTARRFGQ